MEKEKFFTHELEYVKRGYKLIIGIDEAGRGPLAGPVVSSACAFKNFDFIFPEDGSAAEKIRLIRDSKTLSEKQRESLFDFIHEYFYVGVGICNHMTIDRINILEATFLAMKKALTDLKLKINNNDIDYFQKNGNILFNKESTILVDGNKLIKNISINQYAIVSGDKFVKSISAASIVAKVTRDRIMYGMHKKYPEYNFSKHKGYGTKEHRDAIKKHGLSEIHRKSFRLTFD